MLRWAMSEEAGRPLYLTAAVLIMGMALTITGSRSGIAAFVFAMAVMATFVVARVPDARVRKLAASLFAVIVAGAIVWAGVGATLERFSLVSQDAGGRFAAWRDTLRIIGDFPLTGIGVGSYARAMLVYQTGNRASMYAHAHNEYLQVLAEGGLLVTLPVVALVGLIVLTIRRRVVLGEDDTLTQWIRAGAIAGLAGIAAQSLVEFSLQMPGNRVLFVILLAIALHRPGNGQVLKRRRRT
jgi:O-antigen ligase